MARRLIAAGKLGPNQPSLEAQLELAVVVERARKEARDNVVPASELPSEEQLRAVHARLRRLLRA